MVKNVFREIDDISARINMHPEYDPVLRTKHLHYLLKEADRHSTSLELESLNFSEQDIEILNTHKLPKRQAKKIHHESFLTVSGAWEFLLDGGLNLTTLAMLGNIIDPAKNPHKFFRSSDVLIGDVPASPFMSVPHHLKDMLEDLALTNIHPVPRAASAHLSMALIHPYFDGNGRASRLIQNYCLMERGLPPAIIKDSERLVYTSLLRPALLARKNCESSIYEPSNNEVIFNEYIGSKVLDSLIALQEELNHHRRYHVTLSPIRHRQLEFSIKHALESSFRATHNGNVQVRLEDSQAVKESSYGIHGDISAAEVRSHLSQICDRYNLKYSLE